MQSLLATWRNQPAPAPSQLASVQGALESARSALPDAIITSIVFPGSDDGSPHHYLLWAKGASPLRSRLFSPVLVDARTDRLTTVLRMPWYLRFLEICRPLHFGDYGGLPLKIIWGLLDLATIVVLASGLYLWGSRRRKGIHQTGRRI